MKFRVNWPLDTGKKVYPESSTIDLKESEAEVLLASGVISPIPKSAPASQEPPAPVVSNPPADQSDLVPPAGGTTEQTGQPGANGSQE